MHGTPIHMCICTHTHTHSQVIIQSCERTKHVLHKVEKKKIRFPRNPLVITGKIGAIFKMPACLWKSAGKVLKTYMWECVFTYSYVCITTNLFFLFQTETEHINLKVLGQDNAVVQFKIKKHTPLRKLMNAYCDRAVSDIHNS